MLALSLFISLESLHDKRGWTGVARRFKAETWYLISLLEKILILKLVSKFRQISQLYFDVIALDLLLTLTLIDIPFPDEELVQMRHLIVLHLEVTADKLTFGLELYEVENGIVLL